MPTPALIVLGALLGGLPAGDTEGLRRYRGQYTYGHEVSAFCPAISSQCHWVGRGTDDDLRAALRALATTPDGAPYTPVCVVLEGRIDRESERTGFAADYDGLMRVTRVFGRCEDTDIVTEGDLQHHRWVLESVDGRRVDPGVPADTIPELDFGERMTVSGRSGCNRFTGQGVLREDYFFIERLSSTQNQCAPRQVELEAIVLQALGSESVIRIDGEGRLLLRSAPITLRFRLEDWVR